MPQLIPASPPEAGDDEKIQVVSVVASVYFNTRTIPALVERLQEAARQVPSTEFEFLFVDDGSIGKHLWRVLEQSRNRPLYIVDIATENMALAKSTRVVARVDDAMN